MHILKFGGASVRSAQTVKNLGEILERFTEPVVVVISAMGKTTNFLEKILDVYYYARGDRGLNDMIGELENYHDEILRGLVGDNSHPVYDKVHGYWNMLRNKLKNSPSDDYDYEYDQIVIYGELVSTTIVEEYLDYVGEATIWTDIRNVISTDDTYGSANVNWELSRENVKREFLPLSKHIITQGFIASSSDGKNTTLGREGSDFTAAILGYLLDAEEVVIWKDVDGVYSADPVDFPFARKLDTISYREAVELAYYGAKIIHPKTIKPLEHKKIPLQVKSFLKPELPGTRIFNFKGEFVCLSGNETPPVFIVKRSQILISVSPQDFSFIIEANISRIFALLAKYNLSVNLMQHAAISFSVCINDDSEKINSFIQELKENFTVIYNRGLTLITIRHYTPDAIQMMTAKKHIFVEQKTRKSARFVIKG